MHDDYGLKHLFTKQEFVEHHEVLWKYFLKTISCKIFQV